MEALSLVDKKTRQPCELFVAGIGPLETAVRLTRRLSENRLDIALVINFGVAGAYVGSGAGLLDICLAECEVMGDFGICHHESYEPFAEQLSVRTVFPLESRYLSQAGGILKEQNINWKRGLFVTVNGATATSKRGAMLRAVHNGLCENMEGGAVARVCEEFDIPCLEVRCVSNMVEDRNLANWQLAAAVQRCGQAVSLLVDNIVLF